MADEVRRQVVSDPLAQQVRGQTPDRSMSPMGIGSRQSNGDAVFQQNAAGLNALNGIRAAVAKVADAKNDESIVTGKMQFMTGVSEADMLAHGDKYTQQGYEALSSVDQANSWYTNELAAIDETTREMDPKDYQKYLMEKRKEALSNLPNDPDIKKLYVAAFEQLGPRLADEQFKAHNGLNRTRNINSLSDAAYSSAGANEDASRVMPGGPLRVSPGIVSTQLMTSDVDRDAGIRTMLGEAGGEGSVGMAAVAQVLKNRAVNGGFGGSNIYSVAHAPKQFSMWNAGPGGNAVGSTTGRDSIAYRRAGEVYDAVMAGHVADMTNGATHYYSPSGMKALVKAGAQGNEVPAWWDANSEKNAVTIGNHRFAGSKPMSGGEGSLVFAHADQTGIDDSFKGILTDTSAALGVPLKITSGYRSPEHPVEAAKRGGPGEHSHKDASDIDMSGMSDAQRQQLVAQLRTRGVKRFITYSNEPNMLHVDMNSKGGKLDANGNWFMFDKSADNMGRAPAWFQKVAQGGDIPLEHATGSTQVRQLFDASNLKDEDKAIAAADSMVRGLEGGSDQVYNDLGGEAYLRKLGATDAQINAVQAAKIRQTKAAQDRFDVDTERQVEDLKSQVKAGKYKSAEEVAQAVQDLQHHVGQDEAWSHSLANEVLTDWHKKTADDAILNPQLAADLAGVKQQMTENPDYTPKMASDATVAIGEKYGQDGKTVQGWIGDMWALDAARRAKMITELQTEKTKTDKENIVKGQVESSLGKDSGLAGVTGQVRVQKNGATVEVSAQQYGVQVLKDKAITDARVLVDAGKVKAENAEYTVNKTVYEKLAKQGVVDEEHGQEIEGALKGDIVGKDGKISEGATKAFDFWLQMTKNPNVGPAYMATMVKDPDVRTLLNVASIMYDGRGNIEDSLRKASLRISQPGFDPAAKIDMNDKFQSQVGAGVDAAIAADSWRGYFALYQGPQQNMDEAQVSAGRAKYREDIVNRANAYHLQNPAVDPAAHIKMATEDFQNDTVIVNGNLITGKSSEGKRLDQTMGIESFGKKAPEDAINSYLGEFGADLFPNMKTDWGYTQDMYHLNAQNQYNVEYNQNTGTVEVQMWKDITRKEFIGKPQILDAREVGKYWIDSQKQPGMFSTAWRTAKEAIAAGVQNSPNGVPGDGGDGWTLGDLFK